MPRVRFSVTPLIWGISAGDPLRCLPDGTGDARIARQSPRKAGVTKTRSSSPGLRRSQHAARAARRVEATCADAATTAELVDGLREPFTSVLGLSGSIIGSTDPATAVMSTATLVDNLPVTMAEPWMHNEILDDDFNKFGDLHRAAAGATTLGRATQGNPRLSPRFRLKEDMGFGPELRVTFSSDELCWGVASFVREKGEPDFDDEAVAWVDDLRATVSAGLRRCLATEVPIRAERDPGVVTLGTDGHVRAMTAAAGDLLDDLWMCPVEGPEFALSGEAYMVATIARAHGLGYEVTRPARTRLRGRSGDWITVRGDCSFTTEGELAGVVLVLEPSRPEEIAPLVMLSLGLTRRERDVLTEITHGKGTTEIAARLFISAHTVRDHIKSILHKTGTASRSELLSMLFGHESPSPMETTGV